jgi:hypothetical protein
MILVNDSLRFISSIRSDINIRFYNSAEADFDGRFSLENGVASLTVIWKFNGDN